MSRARVLVAALFALACGGMPAAGRCQSIGIFADSGCETTCINMTSSSFFQFYVKADLAGFGMSGASFRIEGLPNVVFVQPVFDLPCFDCPCGFNGCSNPFTTPGIDMSWLGWCQSGPCLPLFRVLVFAGTPPQDTVLRVVGRTPPLDPMFDCPMITLCDSPVFTRMCVAGGTAILNPSGECAVAVEAASWSGIKSLYD